MTEEAQLPFKQPYFLRALHEWCTDNGFTPYLVVKVDHSVTVPPEFVRNGEIVLNVSYDATGNLTMNNEFIQFQARFGGVSRRIVVPMGRVSAIYARENGQGMAFTVQDSVEPATKNLSVISSEEPPSQEDKKESETKLHAVKTSDDEPPHDDPPSSGGAPVFRRVK